MLSDINGRVVAEMVMVDFILWVPFVYEYLYKLAIFCVLLDYDLSLPILWMILWTGLVRGRQQILSEFQIESGLFLSGGTKANTDRRAGILSHVRNL